MSVLPSKGTPPDSPIIPVQQVLEEARRKFQHVLERWAFDVLVLRKAGIDRCSWSAMHRHGEMDDDLDCSDLDDECPAAMFCAGE
ncbi:MAG: hypothetical protein ACR2GY_08230 [Phycisphaerales bacterium]